jgi:hypothetical protein
MLGLYSVGAQTWWSLILAHGTDSISKMWLLLPSAFISFRAWCRCPSVLQTCASKNGIGGSCRKSVRHSHAYKISTFKLSDFQSLTETLFLCVVFGLIMTRTRYYSGFHADPHILMSFLSYLDDLAVNVGLPSSNYHVSSVRSFPPSLPKRPLRLSRRT